MAIDRFPVGGDRELELRIVASLQDEDIDAVFIADDEALEALRPDSLPGLVVLDVSAMSAADVSQCIRKCNGSKLPVIALVPRHRVADLDASLGFDDFLVAPPDIGELVTRAKRVLWQSRASEDDALIRVGDLTVDVSGYEVSLKGRRIALRFKEYELLRLLASNPGRAYSRETLLSQIWGYDYFGGTRTVDVHIRRLRSKIEDADHSFIETIWNVGYRFIHLEPS
jgi:DNA-binding response OmpR family regulator